ncbi:hypothetical protein GCM10009001_35750 [Virgibacillus siamensis]|uniref:Uncharacterized protein n=1 Tax=Virgibacillus siamensis TaxID=480071 RepID=A0ABN1GNQ1_9BACI
MSRRGCENQDSLDKELLEQERRLAGLLDEYDVEFPSDLEMENTIDAIRPYVPIKKRKTLLLYEKMIPLLQRSGHEFINISLLFWVSNTLFYIVGLLVIFLEGVNPYLTAMFLAPIPLIFGLIEVLKSRNEGMAELEMTMKHSLQEIVLSKMVIVGGFNLILNVLFTLILPLFTDGIWLWKLILYWMTPFTVVSAFSFLITSKLRNSYAATSVSMVIWVIISFGVIISQQTNNWLDDIHVFYYIALNISAVTVLIVQIYRFSKRSVSFEFNN